MENVLWKKCEMCDNLIKIKLVSNKNNLNYGKPIKIHEKRRFCSTICQIKWQKSIKWEERAQIIREKGTNRSLFFRGMVDKYSWVDIGSSYLMNDVSAAYLWGNLEKADEINQNRLNSWQKYYDGLKELENRCFIELPKIPDGCVQNAHMFYIKVKDLEERTDLLDYLKKNDINAVFHYVPLHSSEAGLKFSKFFGKDIYTTKESEKLIRLPIYYELENKDIKHIINIIYKFFGVQNV